MARWLPRLLGLLRLLGLPTSLTLASGAVTGVLTAAPLDAPPRPLLPMAIGKLAGRVRLVEDNPINQGVAKAMLNKLGLQWHLANDGAQALAMVRNSAPRPAKAGRPPRGSSKVAEPHLLVNEFDLVPMDCQMPVMDGYQATAAIRALPHGSGAALPIIALTANAMQGDDQVCLDAGMNAFLAKPYTLVQFHAMLATWLPAGAPATVQAAPPERRPEPVQPQAAARQQAAIDALHELDEPGSTQLVTQLVASFLASADANLERAAAALAQGDAKVLVQVSHALKSSAANLGARALAGCYSELEKCGREDRLGDARAPLGQTRREQQHAVLELRELVAAVA